MTTSTIAFSRLMYIGIGLGAAGLIVTLFDAIHEPATRLGCAKATGQAGMMLLIISVLLNSSGYRSRIPTMVLALRLIAPGTAVILWGAM